MLGREDEATAEYEKALALSPDPVVHYNLAAILTRKGKTAEAIAHCRQALALEPDDPALVEMLRKRLRQLESRPAPSGQ
jgi:tetratricopeptide (TPR) repeat protein